MRTAPQRERSRDKRTLQPPDSASLRSRSAHGRCREPHECTVNSSESAAHARALQRSKHQLPFPYRKNPNSVLSVPTLFGEKNDSSHCDPKLCPFKAEQRAPNAHAILGPPKAQSNVEAAFHEIRGLETCCTPVLLTIGLYNTWANTWDKTCLPTQPLLRHMQEALLAQACESPTATAL